MINTTTTTTTIIITTIVPFNLLFYFLLFPALQLGLIFSLTQPNAVFQFLIYNNTLDSTERRPEGREGRTVQNRAEKRAQTFILHEVFEVGVLLLVRSKTAKMNLYFCRVAITVSQTTLSRKSVLYSNNRLCSFHYGIWFCSY
jgi:hypothetical protein